VNIRFGYQVVCALNNGAAVITGFQNLHDANTGGFSALANVIHRYAVFIQRFYELTAINIIAHAAHHIDVQAQLGALNRLVCSFSARH